MLSKRLGILLNVQMCLQIYNLQLGELVIELSMRLRSFNIIPMRQFRLLLATINTNKLLIII